MNVYSELLDLLTPERKDAVTLHGSEFPNRHLRKNAFRALSWCMEAEPPPMLTGCVSGTPAVMPQLQWIRISVCLQNAITGKSGQPFPMKHSVKASRNSKTAPSADNGFTMRFPL